MTGKRPEMWYPKPYTDKEGRYWTYDYDMGWMCAEMWKPFEDMLKQLGPYKPMPGTIWITGTGGDHSDSYQKYIKEMFYNPEGYANDNVPYTRPTGYFSPAKWRDADPDWKPTKGSETNTDSLPSSTTD